MKMMITARLALFSRRFFIVLISFCSAEVVHARARSAVIVVVAVGRALVTDFPLFERTA